jgi:hypothetical protein
MIYVEFEQQVWEVIPASIPSHQSEFRQDRTNRSTLSDNHYAQESSRV